MRFWAAAFICIAIVASTVPALAERRVALVFGADRYEHIRLLDNAVNDARAVEEALGALGFDVFTETNRNLRRMRRALADFAEDAGKADVALVFFAGHGVEIDGDNRLLPTDADASSLEALKQTSLPLNEVRETLAAIAPMALILLDACRNDPFAGLSDPDGRGVKALSLPKDKVKPGLGRIGRAENTLFAFSAAPGETAADGEGDNSPFTTALTRYLGTDGLEIRSVLTLVQQAVYDQTRGAQLPYVESGLPALFFASATADQLPERERLLLAMADVTPDLRAEVETIASDAGMPLAPLYGALIASDIANLDRQQRTAKLEEAAAAFTKVRDELRTLASGDERVTALRRQAEEQLSLGAFEAARAKLTEAADIDATSRETLKANLIERTLSEAATHYLNGGAAAVELKYRLAIADYVKAAALYEEVGEEMPDEDRHQHILTLDALGSTYRTVGSLAGAARAFEAVLRVSRQRADSDPGNTGRQRDLLVSYGRIGDVRVAQGDLAAALGAYEAGLAIATRLATADPANTGWQRDLSISRNQIGDVLVAQGDLAGALTAYGASLVIRERLAAADPANSRWQRDLSISREKVGDVLVAQGDLAGALSAYEAGLAIRERLAAADPGNTGWQRDLSVSRNKIGDVRVAQGDLAGALTAYGASLVIRERLVAADPANSQWQRDLSVSRNKIGDVRVARGDLAGALSAYEAGLAIRERLAAADPGNTGWQRDLSISREKVGDVRVAQGDLAGALSAYEVGRAIAERLVAADPANTGWQRDLSVSRNKIGDVLVAQGDLAGALSAYEATLAIREHLAAADPANSRWQRDLSVSRNKIGDVRVAQGDLAGALSAYETALAIRERLAAADPGNADWQRDLIVSHFKLAAVGGDPQENYRKALDIAMSMQTRGVLAPSDAFIPKLLRERLKALEQAEAAE